MTCFISQTLPLSWCVVIKLLCTMLLFFYHYKIKLKRNVYCYTGSIVRANLVPENYRILHSIDIGEYRPSQKFAPRSCIITYDFRRNLSRVMHVYTIMSPNYSNEYRKSQLLLALNSSLSVENNVE